MGQENAIKKLAAITKSVKASNKKEPKTKENNDAEDVVLQLPIWPEQTRGIPNTIARSSLFNVRFKKTPRKQLKNQVVSALSGIDILYTGEELRQNDETVLLQLLHLAQSQPLGEPIRFTPYSFLKSIKSTTSGQANYINLSESIDRLKANSVKVSCPKFNMFFKASLVRKIYNLDDGTGKFTREWIVWLEPEIINLFSENSYSRLHWDQRLSLKKPIAQWLHSFLTGHKAPLPYKVSTYMQLSNTAAQTLGSFRTALRKGLDDLVKIGFLISYEIDPATDLVAVKKATD